MPTIVNVKRYAVGVALLAAAAGLTGCYYGPRPYAYAAPGYGYHQGYYAGPAYGYGYGRGGGRW